MVVVAVVLFTRGGGDDERPAAEQDVVVSGVAAFPERRVAAGDEIEFKNEDSVAHTFTADGGLFDSGRVEPGGVFRFSFPAAGELTYHCEIHPSMTGRVVVTAG